MTRSPWAGEYARTPNEYIWGLAPSDFARAVCALLPPGARQAETSAVRCGKRRDQFVELRVGMLEQLLSAFTHR